MPTFAELQAMQGPAPAASPPAKKTLTFAELTGGSPAPAPAASEPAAKPPAEPEGGVARAARAFVGGAADIVDLVFAGIPAMAFGTFAEGVNRLQGAFDGRSRKQIAEEGAALSAGIGTKMGAPVRDLLTQAGYLKKGEQGAIGQAMSSFMELLDRDAKAVEERSGGKVLKEDYMMFVNGLMWSLGLKGVGHGTKAVLDAKTAKAAAAQLDALKAERAGETLAAEEAAAKAAEPPPPSPTDPVRLHQQVRDADMAAADARVNAEQLAYKLMRDGAPQKQVDAIIKRNPLVARAMDEIAARRQTAAAFVEEPVPKSPIAEDGTWREGALSSLLRKPSEMSPAEIAARQAAAGGRIDPALAVGEGGRSSRDPRRPAQNVPTLPPEVAPVIKRGPLGEPIEAAPPRKGQRGAADNELLTAMTVGATGLGLAMYFKPDAEEAALAIGAGALLAGRGRVGELTLEAIRNTPDATPLRALLERDTTTLNTLETLARQSPGKFEFSVDQIQQLLKRPEVTKAERQVFERILEGRPPGSPTITAKELMEGKKIATGDFELKKQASDQYAAYGLENIGRASQDEFGGYSLPEGMSVDEMKVPPASTHIWQSPLELGSNNHFSDPNYFGHTRVFEENGVRHVVELQSDLAQKAGKVLTVEERARLDADYKKLVEENAQTQAERVRLTNERLRGSPEFADATAAAKEQLLRMREIEAKLAAGGKLAPAAPMLKDWHKRLIREELADAARAGEAHLRFADADTVAKVEGWPEIITYKEGATTFDEAYAKFRRVGNITLSGGEKVFGEYKSTGNLRVKDGLVEAELEGPQGGLRGPVRTVWAPEGTVRFAHGGETAKALGAESRLHPEHQGIYDRYAGDVTKFLKQLGGKHVVDSAGHGWWEVPVEGSKTHPAGKRAQQFGGLDADLAAKLAVFGTLTGTAWALSDRENRASNAAWTAALVGLAMWARSRTTGTADMALSAVHAAENLLGNISSELRDMSPPLLRRLTALEETSAKRTYDLLNRIGPFVEKLSDVPYAARQALDAAILTGKSEPVLRALGAAGKPELIAEWRNVKATLAELGKGLVDTGRLRQLLPDYYPRIVTDYEGLLAKLGQEQRTFLDTIVKQANERSLSATGEALSPLELSILVNKHLERGFSGDARAGFLKKRAIEEVTKELAPFYAPATESLPIYVRAAVKEIERARFFGKDLVRDLETGVVSIDNSIGNIVAQERAKGKLTEPQLDRLRDLLKSRFGPGERAMGRPYAAFRNMGNAMLLGNIFSAVRNISDVGVIVAMHGALPTVAAAIQMITRKPYRITAADMAMAKHIGEEFIHGTRSPVLLKLPLKREPIQLSTAKFVDWTFKLAGWRFLDVGAKELAINAAVIKHQRLARTAKGQAEIRATYGEYFGKDIDALLSDLRSGGKTPLVHELGIRELADAQPLYKSEMPKAYLDNPNGRVLYMLKTFAIKQLNLVRDRGIKEIQRGNVAKGAGFLMRYTLLAGTAGMSTNMLINALLGRDTEVHWGDIPANAFQNFGFSSYVLDRARQGKGAEAFGALVLPPVQPMVDIALRDPRAISYIPIVGKAAYNDRIPGQEALGLTFGGAEKANKRLKAEERKRLKEELK